MTSAAKTVARLGAVALLAGSSCVLGCGGGSEPPTAPQSPPARDRTPLEEAPEPRTIEEAQQQVERAQAQLRGGTKAESSTIRPDSKPTTPSESAPSGGVESREHDAADACHDPCRALASMRRAVGALCRMTGETDKRCVEAKGTLAESMTRVAASCKCEAH